MEVVEEWVCFGRRWVSPRHLVFKLLVKIQIERLSLTSRDWNKELDLRSLSLVLWIQELDALCGLS